MHKKEGWKKVQNVGQWIDKWNKAYCYNHEKVTLSQLGVIQEVKEKEFNPS